MKPHTQQTPKPRPTMTTRGLLILAASTIVLSIAISTPPAPALATPAPTTITHSESLSAPPVTLPLQQSWRLGGESDEDNFFGVIGQVFTDDQDRIYLVDFQLVEVQLFSPTGEYINTLGRKGDGPGEIQNIRTALLLPDGTLGLVQQFPGRVVKVDFDGTPAGSLNPGRTDPTAGGFMGISSASFRGNNLVFSGTKMSRGQQTMTRTNFIASFTAEGEQQATYVEISGERERGRTRIVEADEFFPHGQWAAGPDGRLFVAPQRNEYRIDVYLPDGTLDRSFTRDYSSYKRTAKEKDGARDRLMPFRRRGRRGGRQRPMPELIVMDTEPDITGIHVTENGEVWVLTSRGVRDQQDGILCTYDVFDPSGTFTHQLSIACEGNGLQDVLQPIGNGRFILVKGQREAMRVLRGQVSQDDEDSELSESSDDEDTTDAYLEIICLEALE